MVAIHYQLCNSPFSILANIKSHHHFTICPRISPLLSNFTYDFFFWFTVLKLLFGTIIIFQTCVLFIIIIIHFFPIFTLKPVLKPCSWYKLYTSSLLWTMDNIWVTLWLVTLSTTMLQVYKKNLVKEKEESHLWHYGWSMSPTTMSLKYYMHDLIKENIFGFVNFNYLTLTILHIYSTNKPKSSSFQLT